MDLTAIKFWAIKHFNWISFKSVRKKPPENLHKINQKLTLANFVALYSIFSPFLLGGGGGRRLDKKNFFFFKINQFKWWP